MISKKNPRFNSMDGTWLCMDKLDKSIADLERVLEIVIENNSDGKQFDYRNCPELADKVNRLKDLVSAVSDKVCPEYDTSIPEEEPNLE